MTLRGLRRVVVSADAQDDGVCRHRSDTDRRARLWLRHECFDDECATGYQSLRDSVEACLLAGLAQQVEERVEGDEDEPEWTGRLVVDHVAEARSNSPRRVVLGQLGEHRAAGVEADHVDAPRCQPDGETPCADAELEDRERRVLAGDLGEKVDRCVDIADALIPIVVDVGEGVAIRRIGVAIHGHIFDHRGC